MHWLNTLDAALLHCVNPTLSNPALDVLMPFFSYNPYFAPLALIIAALLLWKGGTRGRLCVLMLVAAIAMGDGVVSGTLKELIHRPRPFHTFADVHVPAAIGKTDSGSMPSSHMANWCAAALVCFVYYRRSIWITLPLALLVGFSRLYNGVHYPGDVLAGAIVGLGSAAAVLYGLNWLWCSAGRRWFPLWWQRLPSLLLLEIKPSNGAPLSAEEESKLRDAQLMRLACGLIVLETLGNLIYIASGKIGLSGDEAYQWIWSKHLALSYYSKPLLIAVTQFLGTSIWGDNALGVRFFSPIISAVTGLAMLRFLARVANVRVAFWVSVMLPTIPLLAAGSVLMTVDPLSVMFWTLAMIAGWRAIQENSSALDWMLTGLWMGLGFLSKYTELFQLLSWAMIFWLLPATRRQWRKPGPYLGLAVHALCTLPVVIWNSQRHWITFKHVADNGHLGKGWPFSPADIWHGLTHFTTDFAGGELGLLNPFYVLPTVWAAVMVWRRRRDNPLQLYLFCMGAPVFLIYALLTLHTRVYLNWIVPSVLPFLAMAALYWDERWRAGYRSIRRWLYSGVIVGTVVVVILHDPTIIPRVTGRPLPPDANPWRLVEGWDETARLVQDARKKLEAEGKPVFIIGGHYQMTGQLTFNLPDAKAAVRDHPFIFYLWTDKPDTQFYFWPGYEDDPMRKGQNALYVREYSPTIGEIEPPPPVLLQEFESVTNLGGFNIVQDGELVRRVQIIECRNLR